MNSDPLAAAMLAGRQILHRENPGLMEWSRDAWAHWLERQRSGSIGSVEPRLFIFAALTCREDLPLHVGLMQLLSLPGLRCVVTFTLPTEEMAQLLQSQARREEWHTLVHIVEDHHRDGIIRRLPSNQPLVILPHPTMLPDCGLAAILKRADAPGEPDEASALRAGRDGFRNSEDWLELPPCSSGADVFLSALGAMLRQDPAALVSPPEVDADRSEDGESDAWLGWVYPGEGRVEIPTLGGEGELIVTASPDANGTAILRQSTAIHEPDEVVRVRAPARLLTTEPQRIRLEYSWPDKPPTGTSLDFHVPARQLQPWMVSAFLNRGGAGNPVIHSFACGIGCRIAYAEDEPEVLQDIPVVWGVLRDSDRIIVQAKAQSLYFFYIDHAYFNRGHGRSYRIARNRYEAGPVRSCPDDRLSDLQLNIASWRKSGREIIVCPPTEYFAHAHGCADWLETTLAKLSEVTDRPVIVRQKPTAGDETVPLAQALETAHALVTHSSNVAIEAACLGTPVFVSSASAAAPIGRTELDEIETPIYPDREPWLAHLAYNQFSFEEIGDGRAWRMLLELEERDFA